MATRVRTIPRIFITAMRFDDIPAVMEVDRQCFATPWSENAYRTELGNSCARYYVAWLGGKIVGYAGLWVVMDEVHITTLGVDENHRGKKIGERLLVCVLDECRERGADRVTLEVRISNQVARDLYVKYGFQEAAIRKAYYGDNGEDAVVMWIYDLWGPPFTTIFDAHKARLTTLEES